jgi:glycosyltransferase involved in cell wall biosynthesis
VPVYNVEAYIRECVESTLNQTLKDIEVICIDDASTDSSLEILREYEKNDSRLKVIAYETNKSASQARKDGALQAKGEYIMFLDGDDSLKEDACEKLYSMISKEKVDMLQFGTQIINEGNVSEKRIENLEKMLIPYDGRLTGRDVFEGCFIEKKYRFSIWNKIYRADVCKEAFKHVKDGNYPKAQDLYAFFIICYYAKSYCSTQDKYYKYRFGAGITGNKRLTLGQLERYCHSIYVAEAISEFIEEQKDEQYLEVVHGIRKSLLNDCVGNWYNAISDEDASQGFDILCKYWQSTELVAILCEKFYGHRKVLAEKIFGAQSIKCTKKETIKTVGIFYHRYALGGVQRVISLLIPIYMEMGYQIVLFTDELSEENEYELPEGVIRVVLPSSLVIKKEEYIIRAKEFEKYIKEYHIDIMCYQAASSAKLLYDMLLLKLNNIPVVCTVHEVSFQNMLSMNREMVNRPAVYKIADCVTVLSEVDELYWRNLGINAKYIPNPTTEKIIKRDLTEVEKNTIVWIGRLDTKTKRCLDVVDIMNFVVEEIPDAKLLVVGNEFSPGIFDKMKKKIEKFGLEEHVILCGHSVDVSNYYRKAEIHMLTSISETFPMTIVESKTFGVPLVMYELPFIELCRDKRGYLSAEQGDKKAMAENIIKILKDENLKHRLQQEAQESLKPFINYDLKQAWKDIFENLYEDEQVREVDELTNLMIRSFLQHYNYGATLVASEKSTLQKQLKKQAVELKKLKRTVAKLKKTQNSLDYKLGYVILYIPHKIIRTLKRLLGVKNE